MKKHIKLSLWLLFAALAVPLVPTMAIAQADRRMQQLRFRKNYLDAKALYEKRQREGASPAELQKLEKEMKQARNKWIGVVLGIATAVAVTGAAVYAAKPGEVLESVNPLAIELIQYIKNKNKIGIDTSLPKIMFDPNKNLINSKDAQGMAPLHHAAQMGYEYAIQQLLDYRADANVRDNQGRTPLMLYVASENPNAKTIELFIQKGADIHAQDKKGQKAAVYYFSNNRYVIDSAITQLLNLGHR